MNTVWKVAPRKGESKPRLLLITIALLLVSLAVVIALGFAGYVELSELASEEREAFGKNITEQGVALNRVTFALFDLLEAPVSPASGTNIDRIVDLGKTMLNNARIVKGVDPGDLKPILGEDPLFLTERLTKSNGTYNEHLRALEEGLLGVLSSRDTPRAEAACVAFHEEATRLENELKERSQLLVQLAGAYHATMKGKFAHLYWQVGRNLEAFTVLAVLLVAVAALFFKVRAVAEAELKFHRNHLAELVARRTEELKSTNAQLTEALASKDVLIKEIHHRVKNNLTMIAGLVRLQQTFATPTDLDKAFDGLSDRIQAISLVHEKLYEGDALWDIGIGDYIADLCDTLNHSLSREPGDVAFVFDIPQETRFPTKTIVPLGLIITELVTNAIKHAFKRRNGGTVGIGLKDTGESWELTVQDDGTPPATPRTILESPSLGVALVKNLVAQLGGTLELSLAEGTHYTIRFPLKH